MDSIKNIIRANMIREGTILMVDTKKEQERAELKYAESMELKDLL